MSQIEGLLPCPNPWCDEEGEPTFYYGASRQWRINCSCGIAGPWSVTEAEAIAAWNTRPSPSGAREIAELCSPLREAMTAFEQIGIIAKGAATTHGDPSSGFEMIDGYAGDAFQALAAIESSLRSQGRGEEAADELTRLREALDPRYTKASYIGEFHFPVTERDEDGDEYQRMVSVPWTTIKEIMAAIRARASLATISEGM